MSGVGNSSSGFFQGALRAEPPRRGQGAGGKPNSRLEGWGRKGFLHEASTTSPCLTPLLCRREDLVQGKTKLRFTKPRLNTRLIHVRLNKNKYLHSISHKKLSEAIT